MLHSQWLMERGAGVGGGGGAFLALGPRGTPGEGRLGARAQGLLLPTLSCLLARISGLVSRVHPPSPGRRKDPTCLAVSEWRGPHHGGCVCAVALRLSVRPPRPQGSSGLEVEEDEDEDEDDVPEWQQDEFEEELDNDSFSYDEESENLDQETFFFGDEEDDDEGYD